MFKSLFRLFYPKLPSRIGRIQYIKFSSIYILLSLFMLGLLFFVIISHKYESFDPKMQYFIQYIIPTTFIDFYLQSGLEPYYNIQVITLVLVFLFVILINAFRIVISRLHDLDLSGWFLLLSCIPIIGPLFGNLSFPLNIMKGTKEENKYGINDYVVKKTDYIYLSFYILWQIIIVLFAVFLSYIISLISL